MSTVPIDSTDPVETELMGMVDAGLLMLGVSIAGEAVYWATELGSQVLGIAT